MKLVAHVPPPLAPPPSVIEGEAVGLREGLLSNPTWKDVGKGLFDGVEITVAAADVLGVSDRLGVTEAVTLSDGDTLGERELLGVGMTDGLGVCVKNRARGLLEFASSG